MNNISENAKELRNIIQFEKEKKGSFDRKTANHQQREIVLEPVLH